MNAWQALDEHCADFVKEQHAYGERHVDKVVDSIPNDEVLRLFYFMPLEGPVPRFPNPEEWRHIIRHLGPERVHRFVRFQARVRGGFARNKFPGLFRLRQTLAIKMQYLWRRKQRLRKMRAAVHNYHMKLKRVMFHRIRAFSEEMMKLEEGQKRR